MEKLEHKRNILLNKECVVGVFYKEWESEMKGDSTFKY